MNDQPGFLTPPSNAVEIPSTPPAPKKPLRVRPGLPISMEEKPANLSQSPTCRKLDFSALYIASKGETERKP